MAYSNLQSRAPQSAHSQPSNQPPRNNGGRVYVMRKEEAEDAPNVVTGTFPFFTQSVDILFDSGATHSFISAKLVETLGLDPTQKSSLLTVMLPNGKTVACKELYEDYPMKMYECEFPANLYKFELTDFEIILGMDWLAKHQAQIDCPKRKITLRGPNEEKVVHRGARGLGWG